MSQSSRGRLQMRDVLHCNSDQSNPSNSAILLKMDREMQELKEENKKLKLQLLDERSMLEQLLNETSQEKFDERRINLLKAQIIQLERQTLILSEALGNRSENLLEVENVLKWLTDELRSYIAADVKGSNIPVSRAHLMAMVETAESARIKLFKGIENNSKENLIKPTMFINDFIKKKNQEDLTLLDITSGQMSHINLKHVGQLESKLSQLYKELIKLRESLCETDNPVKKITSDHIAKCFKERLTSDIVKSSTLCRDCSTDLLSLSLLYPAAPWSALKRPILKEVTIEEFMSMLPSLPKPKTVELHRCIEGLLKTCNYRHTMLEREVKALRDEVKFHQSIYNHQLTYIDSLFTAVKDGYLSFENSIHSLVVEPLKETLKNYEGLKVSASEKALRDFLSTFKNNEEKLQNVVNKLELIPEQANQLNGEKVFTSFGEEFFHLMDKLVVEQQEKRDREIQCRSEMKEEQKQRDESLKQLIYKMEEKKIHAREFKELRNFEILEMNKNEPKLKKSCSDISLCKNDSLNGDKRQDSGLSPPENISSNCELSNVMMDQVKKTDKPPSGREKFKISTKGTRNKQCRNYEPNLVVPNKTLQLRKSNSISKLNCDKNTDQSENLLMLQDLSTLSMSSVESQPPVHHLAPLKKKKAPFY
ncbi:uncharacterized protein LOC126818094 isoform X2 [Patella vulgata]|uniref:uncharacterized protein LOC126818094 isoform X2 n=1 Tax=Patella vulgata TaxID=6465 RepID=UPI0024A7BC1F|nr:uncharacterized protein LOC126818094 isoform X2 [Patella vulgata]